ncbi:MAG: ParB/RepB/Spo0J family partition protein [Eubacteriales bacterium]|nr:ParB/RepB/Spo0J family partition protein [Eubacteriales bacterium]MDD3073358.1 ParB/RepB/Spo0J family partition protein [Eubacteriales bacterium]MDD4078981.1 ParB/RepB/Spo0J family partition protein [Eubacteriales bacterium]MDD4768388.1 ParB/RepB/Spo0J family partition protein [Eubacteriales bacterium]
MSKRALGRGLGALIPGAEEEVPPSEVSLDSIVPNPHQPRRTFDQEALEELAQSIAQHGLLQPIVVRPHLGRYQLVAGERRFRAAKLAGKSSIPAVIMDLTDRQLAEISLVENLQREDLNPLEEANAYSQLIKEFNLTQEALATRIGKSRSAIANTLRLLNLAPPVQSMVADGRISPGHARTLLSLAVEDQLKAAERIVSKGLTVRTAEKNRQAQRQKKAEPRDPNAVHMQQKLMEHLGTRVALEEKGGKGRIIIEFYSPQDANRIINTILH